MRNIRKRDIAIISGAFVAFVASLAFVTHRAHASAIEQADVYVAADPGACDPSYQAGAWHICGVTVTAPSETYYTLAYVRDGWTLTIRN